MKRKNNEINNFEECKRKITSLLFEYNCTIESDDYHWSWLRDNDTDKTIGFD